MSAVKRVRVEGEILQILPRRFPEDLFSFRVRTHQSKREIICVSITEIPIAVGDYIASDGEMRADGKVYYNTIPFINPKYTTTNLPVLIVTNQKGINVETARQIVDYLGEDAVIKLDQLSYDYAVEGLKNCIEPLATAFPKVKIDKLVLWWNKYSGVRKLQLLGLSKADIKKLRNSFEDTYNMLLTNPYRVLTLDVQCCDGIVKLTQNYKLHPDERRCGVVARYIKENVEKKAWACTPISQITSRFPNFDTLKARLLESFQCVCYKEYIYLQEEYEVESGLAKLLAEKSKTTLIPIEPVYDACTFTPSESQMAAVKLALNSPVCCIIGEAGTGKTTVSKLISANLKRVGHEHLFVSFTGKAVARIKEVTGHKALTIHRAFGKTEKEIVLIPDETSMIETPLFYKYLRNKFEQFERIIFLGDDRQLPPIGWGSLLTELLKCRSIPSIRLNVQFRQNNDSELYQILRTILDRGDIKSNKDCTLTFGEINLVYDKVRDLHDQKEEFIVVSPTNEPIQDLNKKIREIVNPYGVQYRDKSRNKEWRKGDRIMVTKNLYDINVMNGEEGTIIGGIDDYGIECLFNNQKHFIPFNDPDENNEEYEFKKETESATTRYVDLCWAVTVHKTQGSEKDHVIFWCPLGLPPGSFLNNNLIYSGSSRAKKTLTVVGEISSYKKAVHHNPSIRFENLAMMVEEASL